MLQRRPLPALRAALSAALATLSSCTTVPMAALPDPLPETLEWSVSSTAKHGAFLGLDVRENDSGSLDELRIDPGVRVTRVIAGSPAEGAGFQVGDVLLKLDGQHVADPETLEALLARTDPGPAAQLEVQRGDSVFELSVALRPREGPPAAAHLRWRADPVRSRAGWLAGQGGVVLVTSDPEGPFPSAGIDVGSVLTSVAGEALHSERALIRSLLRQPPGARVEVVYRMPSSSEERRATVELYAAPTRVTEASLPILIGYEAEANGDSSSFYLLDLWILSLFEYRREGRERHYSVLSLIDFSTGVGELEAG